MIRGVSRGGDGMRAEEARALACKGTPVLMLARALMLATAFKQFCPQGPPIR